MTVKEFTIKKVITTKQELLDKDEWESFMMFYHLHKFGPDQYPSDEQFVLDPLDAAIFNLIPHEEAQKLELFYRKQLGE